MVERLIHALQALAAPPEVQLARFPDFVAKADELAFWRRPVLHIYQAAMKTYALTIRVNHALDRRLVMLAKRLGVATSSKGFPPC